MMRISYRNILFGAALMTVLAACQDKQQGTKFQPAEKESTMTAEERSQAIARAKAAAGVDVQQLLDMHGVKVSVVAPKTVGDLTPQQADLLATRLLHVCAANGISGLGTSPVFALGATVIPGERKATGTAPQKMIVTYDVEYIVGNVVTGDVYASCTQQVSGAGASFEAASANAVRQIKSTPQIQQMLSTATERIVNWYKEQLPTLKNQVNAAAQQGDYALAVALVSSVPQEATEAYEYATQVQPKLVDQLKHRNAADNLAAMKTAAAMAKDEFNPEVTAYLSLIPLDCAERKQAEALADDYQKKCLQHEADVKAAIERDSAAARKYREMIEQNRHAEVLAKVEADKIVAKSEANATAKALQRDMQARRDEKNKGFWSKLGDRVLNGIDSMGEEPDED
jgi:hypothetical protein